MNKFIASCLFLLALPAWAGHSRTVALAASARPEAYWSFWRGETAAGYRQEMLAVIHALLLNAGADTRVIELADPSVPDQLNRDRTPWPLHQSLCRATGADTLLTLRVEDPLPVFSPWQADLFGDRGDVPSAHWPSLYLIAYDCSNGNRSSEHLTLSPRMQDQFVFETDLVAYTGAFWDKALTRFTPKLD